MNITNASVQRSMQYRAGRLILSKEGNFHPPTLQQISTSAITSSISIRHPVKIANFLSQDSIFSPINAQEFNEASLKDRVVKIIDTMKKNAKTNIMLQDNYYKTVLTSEILASMKLKQDDESLTSLVNDILADLIPSEELKNYQASDIITKVRQLEQNQLHNNTPQVNPTENNSENILVSKFLKSMDQRRKEIFNISPEFLSATASKLKLPLLVTGYILYKIAIEEIFADLVYRVEIDKQNNGIERTEYRYILITRRARAGFLISEQGSIYMKEGLAKFKLLEKPTNDDLRPNAAEHRVIGFRRYETTVGYLQEHLYNYVSVNLDNISQPQKELAVITLYFFNSLTENFIQLGEDRYYAACYAVTLFSIGAKLHSDGKHGELNNLLAQMLELIKKPDNLKEKLEQIIEYANKVKINSQYTTFHDEMYEHIEHSYYYLYCDKAYCDTPNNYAKTAPESAMERRELKLQLSRENNRAVTSSPT